MVLWVKLTFVCLEITLELKTKSILLLIKQFISLSRHLGPDCEMYSLNNNGPCINGGKIKCEGDEVAPDITCECPPPYQGMFCEEKMENVIVFIHFID